MGFRIEKNLLAVFGMSYCFFNIFNNNFSDYDSAHADDLERSHLLDRY